MRSIQAMGGKIIHICSADEQHNIAPELRGHRSEVELDNPEMDILRDAYLFNRKESKADLRYWGEQILKEWGWK